jgi:uncharacterized protein
MIEVIELARVPGRPWRNGGGITHELLAWPHGAGWQMRISVAEIAQDGPFSAFPGVERWFAVLQGAGVMLRFAQRREMLTADSAPLQFDGAAAPGCELLGGDTLDLNLMVRHDAGRGRLERAQADTEWFTPAPLRALFCTAPARLQIDDTDAARLPAMSLAFSAHAGRQRWRFVADGEPARAWWLSFQPAPSR